MTRTVHLPKPLTPDDRLGHIPYAFRHTSATLGWHGLRVEHDTRQPASEIVHPPLECLWLVLTGKIFPERTEEYIQVHLDQNIALADLADVAHLSEFHFARLFKQTTGLPPHQFVIRQRVERAKRLIAAGQLSLAQIAIVVGFSDQSQLSRHFKRLVGVTPKRFS